MLGEPGKTSDVPRFWSRERSFRSTFKIRLQHPANQISRSSIKWVLGSLKRLLDGVTVLDPDLM